MCMCRSFCAFNESSLGSAMQPAQPAAQNTLPLGVELRFLRVVSAMIQNTASLRMKHQLLRIELSHFPCYFPCRRVQQYMLRTERKKVWAFPHFPGVHKIYVFS